MSCVKFRPCALALGCLLALTAGMPSLRVLIEGRSDLSGPLAQLGLGRDGTYYVIAAGRAFHAGPGVWNGVSTGNSSFIGIEAENTGLPGDRWPDIQMDAYRHGVAAILTHIGRGPECCAGHCDYALPKGRKTDPSFSTDAFRASVAAIMEDVAEAVRWLASRGADYVTGHTVLLDGGVTIS